MRAILLVWQKSLGVSVELPVEYLGLPLGDNYKNVMTSYTVAGRSNRKLTG